MIEKLQFIVSNHEKTTKNKLSKYLLLNVVLLLCSFFTISFLLLLFSLYIILYISFSMCLFLHIFFYVSFTLIHYANEDLYKIQKFVKEALFLFLCEAENYLNWSLTTVCTSFNILCHLFI